MKGNAPLGAAHGLAVPVSTGGLPWRARLLAGAASLPAISPLLLSALAGSLLLGAPQAHAQRPPASIEPRPVLRGDQPLTSQAPVGANPAPGAASGNTSANAPATAMPVADTAASGPTQALIRSLLDQANFWRLQNQPSLAMGALERILAVDPGNTAALAAASEAQAQMGHRNAADAYLARLRRVAPNDPRVNQANVAIRAATVDQGALTEARRLAQTGQIALAVQAYRRLFNSDTPPDSYALEYYQTLSGAGDRGYEEARAGLARLVTQVPNDARAQLAYAQVLSYRGSTREQGIQRLERLASRPDTANSAAAAWRQALLWQGVTRDAVPDLEAYLRRYPDDTAINQRLQEARNPPPPTVVTPADVEGLRRQRGFTELNAGRMADAEAAFQANIAANPNDADATGGLGIVRLCQGRFAEAQQLLEKAIALNPDRRSAWQSALDGAAQAQEMASVRTMIQRGELGQAEVILRRAVARGGPDSAYAQQQLGDIALRRGDLTTAESRYRAALAVRPNLAPAASGLYEVLQQQGRFAEAQQLVQTMGNRLNTAAGDSFRAEALRQQASATEDPQQKLSLLEAALQATPSSPWIRLDIARALAQQGRAAEARAFLEGPAANSSNRDTLYAAALFANEQGRPQDALAYLRRIPDRVRTADQNRLVATASAAAEVDAATAMVRSAGLQGGRPALMAIAARRDPQGVLAPLVVRAFGDLNDPTGAREAARAAFTVNATWGAPQRLAMANALLGAQLPADASAVLAQVQSFPNLSPEDMRQVQAAQVGVAVSTSDRLNEQGKQAAAYNALAPALAAQPNNASVTLALGRLYQGAGQPAQAQQVAETVLVRDPANMDARMQALDAAIAQRDWGRAETLLLQARAMNPGDPRVYIMEARIAQGWGDNRRALRALEMAAQLRQGQLDSSGQPQNPMTQNPFAPNSLGAPGTVSDPMLTDINRQLAQAQDDTATRFQGGVNYRSRSGSAGLDKLTEFSAPMEASVAPSIGGRITANITPITIDSGTVDTSVSQRRTFGSAALSSNTVPPAATSGSQQGVGLGLAYQRQNFALDVGTTPLGFREQNVVGGVQIAPSLGNNMRLRVTAERRAVTDSVLSYAGARDPQSGATWGGVTRLGGRAQLEWSRGPLSVYAGGGYSSITGHGVVDNSRWEGGAGGSYAFWRRPDSELTAGMDLVYFGYERNLRHFTLGNGGYFSPQSFVAANFPVDWRARSGNLSWRLGATVGLQDWHERSQLYYPGHPGLQQQLTEMGYTDSTITATYAGRSQTGFSGGARGDLEYALTPTLRVGGLLRYDKSGDWNEVRGMLYARYRLDDPAPAASAMGTYPGSSATSYSQLGYGGGYGSTGYGALAGSNSLSTSSSQSGGADSGGVSIR